MPVTHDNEMYFRMPAGYLSSGRILLGLLCLLELILVWLTFLHHHTREMQQILYRLLWAPALFIVRTLCLSSLTEVTVNFGTRTYRTVWRWPWGARVRRGSLDDFNAVHVTEQGYVSLVGKEPGPREFSPFRRVVPIGNAGLGEYGTGFAREVARKMGVEVVTKL